MSTMEDPMKLLGLLADLLGVLAFLVLVKREIDSAIASLTLPPEMNFYFLFFWALVAAFLGGLFWNGLNRILGLRFYVGGTGSEPHRVAAFIWPMATNIPAVVILVALNRKYHFMGSREQVILYAVFLLGIAVGSLLFYDLPLSGNCGFRNYFDAKHVPFFFKEFGLVVIWSSLLSILGFLPMGIIKIVVAPTPRDLQVICWTFLKQAGLCIGLTTLAVVSFLIAFPGQSRFDSARGIVAGLFLRAALFLGLVFG